MNSSMEQVYSQCLDELKMMSVNSHSLDEYAEKAIQIIKKQIDFLFVGIALLDMDHMVRFYKGTGDKYYQRRLNISLENSNPISLTIRNGSPLLVAVDDSGVLFKNPVFPDEKLQFFLPLKSQEGVFGVIEINSALDLDEEDKMKAFSSLEILSSEVASHCIKLMDKSKIGFWG